MVVTAFKSFFSVLEYCIFEATGIGSSQGAFSWDFTRVGETQKLPCNYGDGEAWRSCKRKMNGEGFWEIPNVELCKHESAKSEELSKIIEVSFVFLWLYLLQFYITEP